MKKQGLSEALDRCLLLLKEEQATFEECLARYPECEDDLRPLLQVAVKIHRTPRPTPSPAAAAEGRRRMLQALAEKEAHHTTVTDVLRGYVGRVAMLFGEDQPILSQKRPSFRLVMASTAVLVLIAIVALSLLLPPGGEYGVAQTASLIQMQGSVYVMSAGGEEWRPASAGEQVAPGDRVRTGPTASVTLTFFDGSTTALEAQTEIAVVRMSSQQDGNRTIVLRQISGQTYSQVRRLSDSASRFEIESPEAVASVRGTAFSLSVEPDGTTRVIVTQGAVNVTAQGVTVVVQAGEEAQVQPGHPPTLVEPTPTPTPTTTATPRPSPSSTPTLEPTEPPKPTATPEPTTILELTGTPEPSKASPGITETEESPEPSKVPPGLTKTPQPPGQTKTPNPPGQKDKPDPPGQDKKPKPKKP